MVTTRKIRCRFWTAGSTLARGIILVNILLRNSALRFVNPLTKTTYKTVKSSLFHN